MSKPRIKLNHSGMAAMLKSPAVGAAVAAKAAEIAKAVNDQGLVAHAGYGSGGPAIVADVRRMVTDRQKAIVNIQHPAAAAMQAKYGVLTKAAGASGAEVVG